MKMNIAAKSRIIGNIGQLTASGVCLALCMVLPFLTGQVPKVGNALSPMHIPVLICGFVAGPFYAAIVGFIAPLLRFPLFGSPPIMPTGVAMCFELAVYGFVAGMLHKTLPKRHEQVYVALVAAMLAGRIVWGIARWALSGVTGVAFTLNLFMAGAFVNAVPGIVLHIAFIPPIVIALKKAGFVAQ